MRTSGTLDYSRDDTPILMAPSGMLYTPGDTRTLGRAIMDTCQKIMEKLATNPFKTPGPVVTCPHSDAIRPYRSMLFHMGCELHLCDECHVAMIAEMKLSTMPYDERCPITGKTTTVHAPMPGLFD